MRWRFDVWFAFTLALIEILVSACNFRTDKTGGVVAVKGNYFDYISKNIFSQKCMPCHNGPSSPKGMDLSSYDAIMKSNMLIAKDAANSILYQALKSGRMPPAGALSAAEIQVVADWINMGAPRTGGAPPSQLPPPTPPPPPDPDPTPKFAYINKYVIQKLGCVGCHSGSGTGMLNGMPFTKPAGDLDLSSYDDLMAAVHVVRPGDGDNSKFWMRLDDGSMPPAPMPGTSKAQRDAIHQWIDNGADNN